MGALLLALWRRRTAARDAGDRLMEGLAASVFLALSTYLVGVFFLPIAYPRYLWVIVGVGLAVAASPVPAPACDLAPLRLTVVPVP
jgi:hypothetical protein